MSDSSYNGRGVLHKAEERIEEKVGGPARLKIIALLAAVLALDTADKGTVSAVAGSLEKAFNIGHPSIGVLLAAVSFVGAVFALPMGVLVDRTRRKRLLMVVIAVWSVAMAVSGTSTSFIYLLVTRIFLGAVTAAATLAGELVGMGIGFFVSGEVSSWLDWRWSFYVMGVPGVALVFILWRFLPEPARGGQSWIGRGEQDVRSAEDVDDKGKAAPTAERGKEPPAEQAGSAQKAQESVVQAGVRPREALILHEDPSRRSLWWAIRYVVRIPTYVLIIFASSLGYYFFSGVRGFAMIYVTGHYGITRSVASALVVVLGIGAVAGVVAGGRISAWLLDRRRFDARILVPGVALGLSVLLFAPGIWTSNVYIAFALLTLGAAALAAANPPIDAARLDIIHPRLWGRAEAGRMALRAGLEGSAPIVFGLMSDWLGGGQKGLEWTYLLMLIPVAVAASLAIPARRTYPRDVATAAASVKETSGP